MKKDTDITVIDIHMRAMEAIENKYKDILHDVIVMIRDAADMGEFRTKINISKEESEPYGFISVYLRMKGFGTSIIDNVFEIEWDEPTVGTGKNIALERFQTKQPIRYL